MVLRASTLLWDACNIRTWFQTCYFSLFNLISSFIPLFFVTLTFFNFYSRCQPSGHIFSCFFQVIMLRKLSLLLRGAPQHQTDLLSFRVCPISQNARPRKFRLQRELSLRKVVANRGWNHSLFHQECALLLSPKRAGFHSRALKW